MSDAKAWRYREEQATRGAKALARHYFELDRDLTDDCCGEIETLVDYLIEAAAARVRAELAEKAEADAARGGR